MSDTKPKHRWRTFSGPKTCPKCQRGLLVATGKVNSTGDGRVLVCHHCNATFDQRPTDGKDP